VASIPDVSPAPPVSAVPRGPAGLPPIARSAVGGPAADSRSFVRELTGRNGPGGTLRAVAPALGGVRDLGSAGLSPLVARSPGVPASSLPSLPPLREVAPARSGPVRRVATELAAATGGGPAGSEAAPLPVLAPRPVAGDGPGAAVPERPMPAATHGEGPTVARAATVPAEPGPGSAPAAEPSAVDQPAPVRPTPEPAAAATVARSASTVASPSPSRVLPVAVRPAIAVARVALPGTVRPAPRRLEGAADPVHRPVVTGSPVARAATEARSPDPSGDAARGVRMPPGASVRRVTSESAAAEPVAITPSPGDAVPSAVLRRLPSVQRVASVPATAAPATASMPSILDSSDTAALVRRLAGAPDPVVPIPAALPAADSAGQPPVTSAAPHHEHAPVRRSATPGEPASATPLPPARPSPAAAGIARSAEVSRPSAALPPRRPGLGLPAAVAARLAPVSRSTSDHTPPATTDHPPTADTASPPAADHPPVSDTIARPALDPSPSPSVTVIARSPADPPATAVPAATRADATPALVAPTHLEPHLTPAAPAPPPPVIMRSAATDALAAHAPAPRPLGLRLPGSVPRPAAAQVARQAAPQSQLPARPVPIAAAGSGAAAAAVASGLAAPSVDGSVVFAPPPGAPWVHRQETTTSAPSGPSPVASTPITPPDHHADADQAHQPDLAALADDIYERIEHRLRMDLLLERERRGLLADP
jgi:hypothetical protein